VALFGYALLIKMAAQFISNIINKVIFIDLSHSYQMGDFKFDSKYTLFNVTKNLFSTLIGVIGVCILYYTLFDQYFYKFSLFPVEGYAIIAAWLCIEIIYFVLYQYVQVNGFMWLSILFISLPSVLYALTIYLFQSPITVIGCLITYTGLTIVSNLGICGIIYRRRRNGSKNV
jgi:hypothetical protein